MSARPGDPESKKAGWPRGERHALDEEQDRFAVIDQGTGENDLAVKVTFLRRRAFPEPPEAIETHMSWVFLTSDRAYKLKKPLKSPFFDNRSIEGRRVDCEAEIELNQALAPGVYLRTIPLTRRTDGLLALDGQGDVVDWLVVMRRLPADSMLDRRLSADAGSIRSIEIDALARHLDAFYRNTEPAPTGPGVYRAGLRRILAEDRAELLRHDHALDHREINALTDTLSHAIATLPELDDRSSCVVDGHGDLRPEHVLLGTNPAVIDRITFDRRVRLLDPPHDVALLAVECDYLGASGLGSQIIARYLTCARDAVTPATIALYRALRATTRARLSVAHLADSDRDASKWLDRTDAYLAIAGNGLDRFGREVQARSGVEME